MGNTGYVQLPTNNYTDLLTAVATKGPISISVAAGGLGWQLYFGGIMSGSNNYDMDHAVLLVGYGTDNGKDYWLIRNSWGSGWGEHGYARLVRGIKGLGECDITIDAAYPIVDGSKALSSMNPIPLGKIALVAGGILLGV